MNERFRGTIVLRQSGDNLTGTWHTSEGKVEPDTSVVGRIDGMTIVLSRFIAENQQNFVLTLSSDGSRLDGFGDGWFLRHTNLNMQRVVGKTTSTKLSSAGREPVRTASGAASVQTPSSPPAQSRPAPSTSQTKKQQWMGIGLPPQRGTYRWVIQSVAVHGASGTKYSSFYYDESTGRSVEHPLSLSSGGQIVGVFPDDCMFAVHDEYGHSFTFRNQDEAKAHGLGPGTWSVYPLKCGGVAVYVR
jgi:hypothetical protein